MTALTELRIDAGLGYISPTILTKCETSDWFYQPERTKKEVHALPTSKENQSTLDRREFLLPYTPPEWAKHLRNIPRYRVKLCNSNTPIHKWNLPGVPDGIEIFIKRDDMNAADLSGNKTRRLEFLLADAIDKGCTSVITAGDISSNHCRCTAIAGRRLGLKSHLIIRVPNPNSGELPCTGNSLLYRMTGAKLYLTPLHADYLTQLKPRVEQLVTKLKKDHNEEAYPIHYGGSSSIGVYGCLENFNEFLHQGVQNDFTDIAVTVSSVGEVAGLAFGNYLTQSKLSIHGFCFSSDKKTSQGKINRLIKEMGVQDPNHNIPDPADIVDIIDSKDCQKYSNPTREELDEFICDVASSTGVILDPTYTGKSAFHLVKQLQLNPERFSGKKILFIHTGGIYALFDEHMETVVRQKSAANIHLWTNLEDKPLQRNGYARITIEN